MGHLLVGRSIRKRRNSLTSQVRLGNAEDEMAVPVVKAPGTRHVRVIVEMTDDSRESDGGCQEGWGRRWH